MTKTRKVPQRTCLGCQSVRPKREMARVVRTPAGEVVYDPTGKKAGRGAYICPRSECLAQALSGNRLDRALEVQIGPQTREALRQSLAPSDGR
ncbi:MAG: RNase P modulator RnpM [Bacteroidota bacterium]